MKTLIIGYTKETILVFRKKFDVAFVVSDNDQADINWWVFHNLGFEITTQSYGFNNEEVRYLMASFEKFSDMSTRRYAVIHAHHSTIKNILMLTYYKVVEIIEDLQIEQIIFQNMPHEGFDFIFYSVAKYRGIRTIITNQTQFENRFWIVEDIEDFGVGKNYDLSPSEDIDLNLPEKWFYVPNKTQFTQKYRILDIFIDSMRSPNKIPVFLLKYYYSYRFLKNETLYTAIRNISDIDFEFIYYPLHMEPEMNVTSMGGQDGIFSDQLLVLETLSSYLPDKIKIIIKENPKQTYKSRDEYFFQRIREIPNIILADRWLDSRELIRKSMGVVTLSGTVGWEALFYGKPCLTFGNAWYNSLSGVTRFSHGFSVTDWMASGNVSRDIIEREMRKLLRGCGIGIVDTDYIGAATNFDPIENAVNVVDSIQRYIMKAPNAE